jgi:hypothetical protein
MEIILFCLKLLQLRNLESPLHVISVILRKVGKSMQLSIRGIYNALQI